MTDTPQTPEDLQAELADRGWNINLSTAAHLLKIKQTDPKGEQMIADLEKIAKRCSDE